jgi:predicted RNA-binding Zn ribbon-like protein
VSGTVKPIAIDFLEADEGQVVHQVDLMNAWLGRRGIRSVLDEDARWPMYDLYVAVRDLLYAAARGDPPPQRAIDLVNAASASAPTAPQLHWPAGRAPSVWETTGATSQEYIRGLISRSAMELTSLPGNDRLRMCRAWPCERLFVTSNPRRRWCSEVCGNRERVARFAARQKARDSGSDRPGSAPAAGAGPP